MRSHSRWMIRLLQVGAVVAAATGVSVPRAAEAAPRGQVLLPSGTLLSVEVSDDPVSRARGYMFREKIGKNEGMVFLMEEIGFHSFWMKNCKVSLDIIWMDENWRVVHIERRLPPCQADPCPSYYPMQASLYVLEVAAGGAAREKLALGDRIVFTPPTPK